MFILELLWGGGGGGGGGVGVRLDLCKYPLTDAHQPPFWPGAQAGSRRLHSAETSLRKTKKDPQKNLHKGDHNGRNLTGNPPA